MGNNADQPAAGNQPGTRATPRDTFRDALVSLLEQAQHEISVFGPVLDGHYFNTQRTAKALGQFIARHHRNRARVLVEDGQQLIRDNPRLLELARRFADAVEIRRVGEDHVGLRELFVVTDSRVALLQPDIDQPWGGPPLCATATLARRFQAMWGLAEPLAGISPPGL